MQVDYCPVRLKMSIWLLLRNEQLSSRYKLNKITHLLYNEQMLSCIQEPINSLCLQGIEQLM